MTELTWDNPPPPRAAGPPSTLQPILDELKTKPGQWALLRTFADSSQAANFANSLRQRAAKTEGTFKVAQRTDRKSGTSTVRGCFVG